MKVIIGGCGRVGAQLATKIAFERHEVVVIDKNGVVTAVRTGLTDEGSIEALLSAAM